MNLSDLLNFIIEIVEGWNPEFNWVLYAPVALLVLYQILDFVGSLVKPVGAGRDTRAIRQRPTKSQGTKYVAPAKERPTRVVNGVVPEPITPYISQKMQLRGSIYVLSYFVSTSMQSWDVDSTGRVKESIRLAEEWLEQQASKWGSKVSFQNGYFGDCSDGYTTWRYHCPKITDSYEYEYDFLMELIRNQGFQSLEGFANWAKAKYHCQQCIVMCFVRTSGRSHAWHGDNLFPLVYNYAWYQRGKREIVPGTIAHELLHVFGAIDLYSRAGYPKKKSDTAQCMYPNSIMIDDKHPLSELDIDEVNAWHVGIGPKREEWFGWF